MSTKQDTANSLDELINSGLYKVVDLNFFNYIKNLEVSKEVLEIQKEFLESYKKYLEEIKSLPSDLQKLFLMALKNEEIVANHSLEKVNPFLVSLHMLKSDKTAIDKLLEIKEPLNNVDFLKLHQLLLKNTPSSEENLKFRQENTIFVGYYLDNERQIEYFPIDYRLIPEAVKGLLEIYNSNEFNLENAFLKPIILHGLIAGIQIFKDGNTRLARMFQHVSFYKSSKEFLDENLELPALYVSKNYFLYRKQNRDLIRNLVIQNDYEIWNNWLKFNYHRFEEQLNLNEKNLETLKLSL